MNARDGSQNNAPGSGPEEPSRALAHLVAQKLDAPRDRPRLADVVAAMAEATRGLEIFFDIEGVADRLHSARPAAALLEAPGAAHDELSRRRGKHIFYALLVELSARLSAGQEVDGQALKIVGAWGLRALMSGWLPDGEPVAKVRAVLMRPESKNARSWSTRGRRRCHDMAVASLRDCIVRNSVAAEKLGFKVAQPVQESDRSPVDQFNLLFRKRLNALQTTSSRRAAAGVGGHGTLTASGLLEAGRELLDEVLAGDSESLLHYLQVISHLSDRTIRLLPVVQAGEDPAAMLAWIDLDSSHYCYRLFRLLDRGSSGKGYGRDRFEPTEQVVRLHLAPVAGEMLRLRSSQVSSPATNVQGLLGSSSRSARSGIVGHQAYRRTARKVQESLPVHLLALGGNRWPILLASSSPFLASVGRHSYGACPQSAIQREFDLMHGLLGWPLAPALSPTGLVGSRVTPTATAVAELADWLAAHADRHWQGLTDQPSIIASLRALAPWMSFILAFSLALRMRLVYRVPRTELCEGTEVAFDDKHVHAMEPYPVPIGAFLARAVAAYAAVLDRAAAALEKLPQTDARVLASELRSFQVASSNTLIVDVDAAGRAVAAGYRTWHDASPRRLVLPGNFARQFWPLRALYAGLPQRLLDVLMRHQLADLHLGALTSTGIKRRIRERLQDAIDAVTADLGLNLPECLKEVV